MSSARYTLVARILGDELELFTVTGYDQAECCASRLRRYHPIIIRKADEIAVTAEIATA